MRLQELFQNPRGQSAVELQRQLDSGDLAERFEVPRIYFLTRTHSQVSQAVRELGRTDYRPRMAVLGSRKHTCINTEGRFALHDPRFIHDFAWFCFTPGLNTSFPLGR